uniref:type IV secretory system conjugative DNA transfer family protein n=1 Tax=Longibaculum muris TaxID=1796628 RepID=UPI003AB4B7AF
MKRDTIIFSSIMGIIVFYIGDRVGEIYHNCAATDFSSKLNAVNDNLHLLYEVIYISLDFNDILWGILGVVFCGLFILYQVTNHKNRMPGIEHGSAKWGDKSDIAKMVDKKYENNILLTQTERMSINTRQTMRNNNILVVGGSGTGKTRFFVKPSFMQMHSSYVATDPKGSILEECGKMLYDNGYVIKTINL